MSEQRRRCSFCGRAKDGPLPPQFVPIRMCGNSTVCICEHCVRDCVALLGPSSEERQATATTQAYALRMGHWPLCVSRYGGGVVSVQGAHYATTNRPCNCGHDAILAAIRRASTSAASITNVAPETVVERPEVEAKNRTPSAPGTGTRSEGAAFRAGAEWAVGGQYVGAGWRGAFRSWQSRTP